MKSIKFTKFDEFGNCKGEIESKKVYTVRSAMEHLKNNGFFPMFNNGNKIQRVWTNGKGINAHIL